MRKNGKVMERKIRVYGRNKFKMEVREVDLQEAEKILRDSFQKYLVIDRKTHEFITEITPDVVEITLLPILVAGG